MIRLYINNVEVELTKDVQFAITKQFEDLTNPTAIINTWSKTVSIPFTQKNNELFGHIYNPDKIIVEGNGLEGVYFNPLLKMDFRLEWDKAVLMVGYAKMNEVKQKDGTGTYEITLFGELGKVFQEMQKITYDKSSPLTDYIIAGENYVDEVINKELILSSWTSNGQSTEILYPKWYFPPGSTTPIQHPAYKLTDIIGFAPNNSFCNEFDYKTFQTDAVRSKSFKDVLGTGFTEDTGIEPDTAIPDGLLPREIGEYRSYQQLPFIYWNKFFKIFQEKAEEVTGYQFEYDNEWFNRLNPYWYNLVYMLKPFDAESGELYTNNYTGLSTRFYSTNGVNLGEWRTSTNYQTEYTERLNVLTVNSEQLTGVLDKDDYHNQFVFGDNDILNFHYKINTYLMVITGGIHIKDNNGLLFTITATGSNGRTTQQQFLVRHTGSTITYDSATVLETGDAGEGTDMQYAIIIPTMDMCFNLTKRDFGETVIFSTKCRWLVNEYPMSDRPGTQTRGTVILYYGGSRQSTTTVGIPSTLDLIIPNEYWFHTNADFILNDLWNNDYNVFGEILKYCKMYRIGIFVDEIKKKIKFIPIAKYFSEYTISDWTDRIDKSKDYVIKPITFEDKYVIFNYEDNETQMGKEYKERYGFNYGDYRLITEYNFNEETNELFEDVKGSIINTDNVLSWTNLYNYHRIIYSLPAETSVYCKDDDRKFVDTFGQWYLHNGLAGWSTEEALHLRTVNISDDTGFQQCTNTYFYVQQSSLMVNVATYPKLDVLYGDSMCIFNVPMENYTYIQNYSGKYSIYNNMWDDYLNERYNPQNKIITCYMTIKPHDYINFEFRNFVKIGNQLCMINKIYDYDVTNVGSTKVDLITIQNLKGYMDDDYLTRIDHLTLRLSGDTYLNGEIFNPRFINDFESLSEVTFTNGESAITINNVRFTIVGNEIYAETLARYVDEPDINFTLTLVNKRGYSASMPITRYSVYPYPYMEVLYNGQARSRLLPGSNSYLLTWERTYTNNEEQGNEPDVTVTGSGQFILPTSWTCEEKMYQIGDDEYFMYMWTGQLDLNDLTPGTQITIKVVDAGGWNKTRTYTVANS